MVILGIDASGPANPAGTALAWFDAEDEVLRYRGHRCGATDADVMSSLGELAAEGELLVAIDAPLSYNDGGGYRVRDRSLRKALNQIGATFVGVMSPLYGGMAYLTLRGVSVARLLQTELGDACRVVEAHPGAAMALRGAPFEELRIYKKDRAGSSVACQGLGEWLSEQDLAGLPDLSGQPHVVDACAAALAAWHWRKSSSVWLKRAEPPHHPFDFAC